MRATPDDIVGMAFFARVVEARSFSDAARALGVSKSAVSARVSRLEQRLGVRLLHRTTRRLALTADGVRLYEHCARIVAEAEDAATAAAGASAIPRGPLRLYASASLAHAWLAPALRAFVHAFPDVRVELRLGERIPDLAASGIDVAVVLARRLVDSGLSVRRIASSRVVACAAPAYLRERGIPFRPQDLVLHDCIAHAPRDSDEWSFATDEGPVSMSARAVVATEDLSFSRSAAIAGVGIAMLPELLVADDLAAGRLHRVLDDFLAIELGVHVLHPHARLAPANVRAFVEHVAEWFRAPPWRAAATPRPARKARAERTVIMTEQDVRRLGAVAALYEEVDPEGAARVSRAVASAKVTLAAKVPRTTVTMSSRVVLRDGHGREREVSLAYPWDARGERVSVASELGAALLGASVGKRIADGGARLTVASIPYQPEAAGDHHL